MATGVWFFFSFLFLPPYTRQQCRDIGIMEKPFRFFLVGVKVATSWECQPRLLYSQPHISALSGWIHDVPKPTGDIIFPVGPGSCLQPVRRAWDTSTRRWPEGILVSAQATSTVSSQFRAPVILLQCSLEVSSSSPYHRESAQKAWGGT